MMNIKDLVTSVKELVNGGLPFMEGKEKGDFKSLTTGEIVTISDYGYLESNDGQFVCFTTKEEPTLFYFGGSVMTEKMKKLDSQISQDQIEELLEYGFTVSFGTKKSANKREYTTCEFFPNQE